MAGLCVELLQLPHGEGLPLPAYQTPDSAGCDLYSAQGEAAVVLEHGSRVLIPTGICIALPRGFEGQVRPRSGLAWKEGITVLNAPGTIDADYRGEIKVMLVNLGSRRAFIHRGDRIAQLVVSRCERVEWAVSEPDAFPAQTERGDGGFGSTG